MNISNNSFTHVVQPTVNSSATSITQSNLSIPTETETNPHTSSIEVVTLQAQPAQDVDHIEPMEEFNHLLFASNRIRNDVEIARLATLQNPY